MCRETFLIREKVRAKHKFAATDLQIGDSVYMYGVLVGETTRAIAKGELVNTRNLVHRSAEYSSPNPKINGRGPVWIHGRNKPLWVITEETDWSEPQITG